MEPQKTWRERFDEEFATITDTQQMGNTGGFLLGKIKSFIETTIAEEVEKTLTAQLAKAEFTDEARIIRHNIKEAILALHHD